MGVSFARERFNEAWPGIEAMLDAHWQEVAFHGDTRPCPDVPGYAKACAEGRLVTFTARDPDRKLIGYATFWVGSFAQKAGITCAWQDAIYLEPESRNVPDSWWLQFWCWITRKKNQHRKPGIGVNFLRYCDSELGKMGCHIVHHSVREGRDFSPVLRRLGYAMAETVWARQLPHVGGAHG